MHLAVDGWNLIERPWSAQALHLSEWLEAMAAADPDLRLSLVHPEGQLPPLPEVIYLQPAAVKLSAWGALRYQQRELPRLARALGADLLFIPRPAAPLASPVPVAALLHASPGPRPASALARLRRALGAAGAAGAACRLVLADLPTAGPGARGAAGVPPFVGSGFLPLDTSGPSVPVRFGLAPGYVLCCGLQVEQLPLLLAAWTWVEGSIGDAVPLALLGLNPSAEQGARARASELGIETSLKILPPAALADLPDLYRGATAYLSLGPVSNGQPLRWALSCGVPVAGLNSPETGSILGEAAYLVPPGEARRLGAACLTLLVEEQVATALRQKGLGRATAYHGRGPLEAWLRVFRSAAS
jgi:hypothetical protein